MFGSVSAQTDLQLAMCFWSEIAPLELALAVRSGSLGANSDDDELAGGGKIRKKQESRSKKEEGRESHLSFKSRDPHLEGGEQVIEPPLIVISR